jgi:hypothetical protein
VALGTKAASLIGDGLYGVDLKETPAGLVVVEVNDNPNIDAGVEDAILKDELYKLVIRDFIRRIEKRTATLPQAARAFGPAGAPSTALFPRSIDEANAAKDKEREPANANGRVVSSG